MLLRRKSATEAATQIASNRRLQALNQCKLRRCGAIGYSESRLAHAPRTRLGAGKMGFIFEGFLSFRGSRTFTKPDYFLTFLTKSKKPAAGAPAAAAKEMGACLTENKASLGPFPHFLSMLASFEPDWIQVAQRYLGASAPVILLARWEPRGLAPLVRRRFSPFFGKCWLPFGLDFADRPAALTGKNIYV